MTTFHLTSINPRTGLPHPALADLNTIEARSALGALIAFAAAATTAGAPAATILTATDPATGEAVTHTIRWLRK